MSVSFLSFQKALNSVFTVSLNQQIIEIQLIEVMDQGSTAEWESFSLLFEGPGHTVLEQSIYAMQHEQLDLVELFMVPIGQTPKGYKYQIIFNRYIGTESL